MIAIIISLLILGSNIVYLAYQLNIYKDLYIQTKDQYNALEEKYIETKNELDNMEYDDYLEIAGFHQRNYDC